MSTPQSAESAADEIIRKFGAMPASETMYRVLLQLAFCKGVVSDRVEQALRERRFAPPAGTGI